MPFITSALITAGVAAGVASFLGSLITGVIVAGLGIAIKYIAKSLSPKEEQQEQQRQASQLQTVYGDTQPRTVILGTVGTAGHHVYRNAYGPGNTFVQDVYVLSHFRISSVSRVRYDGQWRTISSEDGRIEGIDATIYVRLYTGTMDQAADPLLIADSNPPGRWTEDHRGAGVAYAVVINVLNRETLPQPWQPFFEVRGAPLYDWRKDSSVGGSGSHRWADHDTWEFSENPALQLYALERGLHNGSEKMVGKGVDAARLPLAEWTQAANICDESVSGAARYSASCIVNSGSGTTHDANMAPLLEACAASWVQTVGKEFPLVGANQSSVATITDDDLIVDAPFRLSLKRPRTELVNTVAATYVSPDSYYEQVALATRIDDGALAADRERLAVSIPYRAVTIPAVGDRLADIAIRASRYQANASIWVLPKFLGVQPGNWITWVSEKRGFTKTFQVVGRQLGAFGNGARNIGLTLQEVDDGIFDPTAYATLPPDATGRGAPEFQSELENFIASPYTVIDPETDKQYPAIRATWDAPTDPTVTGVELFWRPAFQPEAVQSQTVPSDHTTAVMTNGVISDTLFEVAYRLTTHPYRVTPLSAWFEVTTNATPFNDVYDISLEQLSEDVQAALAWLDTDTSSASEVIQAIIDERAERLVDATAQGNAIRALTETVSRTALTLSDTMLQQKSDMVLVREELVSVDGSARAFALDQIQLAVGPGSALAERLTQIEAEADSDFLSLTGSIGEVQSIALDAVSDEAMARQALRIQLVGNYTGNDISLVTEGLLYQDRQAWISETQALSNAIDLVSAGVGILFDWSVQWTFTASAEGWTGNGTPTVSGGWIRPANHVSDPYIVSPDDLGIDGDVYTQVKLRIRKTGTPTWEGYVWWQGAADSTWDAGRRETVAEPSYVDDVAVITVDMDWSGTIDRLRVDLSAAADDSHHFELDWVYVGRPSPGASQAQVAAVQSALASEILAEASSREDLSVILTGLTDPTGATLGSLSAGLIYDERTARVSGDGTNLLLIEGLAAQIEDEDTGLEALAQAQSTMSGDLSILDGIVSGHASSISDILVAVGDLESGKASVGVTDGLQSQIDDLGGGNSTALIAAAVRSLRLTVDRLALSQAGGWLATETAERDLSGIIANVDQALTSRIDITDDQVSLHGSAITSINLALTGFNGTNAVASAFSARDAAILAIDGVVNAQATALETLFAAAGGDTAEVRVKWEASAGPTGYGAQYGIRVTNNSDVLTQAAMFLQAPNAGGKGRIVLDAPELMFGDISAGAALVNPLVYSGGVWRLAIANIGTVTAGEIIL